MSEPGKLDKIDELNLRAIAGNRGGPWLGPKAGDDWSVAEAWMRRDARPALIARLSRAICTPFAWRVVIDTGVWLYEQNAITGDRRVRPGAWFGYQPIATSWLNGGEWGERSHPPVCGISSIQRR